MAGKRQTGAAVVVAIAAATQAFLAWRIKLLTKALVRVTTDYAVDTKRLADATIAAEVERRLTASRAAANQIIILTVNTLGGLPLGGTIEVEELSRAATEWSREILGSIHLVEDEEVVARIQRMHALAFAGRMQTARGRERKVRDGLSLLFVTLREYVRGEPLSENRMLPHEDQAVAYIRGPADADALEYLDPPGQ